MLSHTFPSKSWCEHFSIWIFDCYLTKLGPLLGILNSFPFKNLKGLRSRDMHRFQTFVSLCQWQCFECRQVFSQFRLHKRRSLKKTQYFARAIVSRKISYFSKCIYANVSTKSGSFVFKIAGVSPLRIQPLAKTWFGFFAAQIGSNRIFSRTSEAVLGLFPSSNVSLGPRRTGSVRYKATGWRLKTFWKVSSKSFNEAKLRSKPILSQRRKTIAGNYLRNSVYLDTH